MSDSRRPVIGICTALARANWGVWDRREAALLAFSYIEAVQRAGGMAVMIPPDGRFEHDPDEILDLLDGLILAGGNDIDPARYGADPDPQTHHLVPERDRSELALAIRAVRARHPRARHLPRHAAAQRRVRRNAHPAPPGRARPRGAPPHTGELRRVRPRRSSDLWLTRSARCGRGAARHEVPSSSGRGHHRRGPRRHRPVDDRRSPRGDRGARAPIRAGRPVASRGR